MKFLFIVIWAFLTLSFQGVASACIYYGDGPPAKTVSQLFNGSEIVVRGRVLYIDNRNLQTTQFDRVARLGITEVFKVPLKWTQTEIVKTQPAVVDVHYTFVGGQSALDCGPPNGTHFVTGKEYLVFAKRDNASTLYVTHTSGKHGLDYHYNERQILDFIHKGEDSELKSEFCYRSLRQLYAENIFTGEFSKSQRAPCLDDFYRVDRKYSQKKKPKP